MTHVATMNRTMTWIKKIGADEITGSAEAYP